MRFFYNFNRPQRALDKDDISKCERLQKRAELIEYHFDSQPIINREIII